MRATMNSISGVSTMVLRKLFRHQTLTRTGFVDYVDSLVGQQTVADMLHRQIDRRLDRIGGVFDFVMLFETRFQDR